MRDTVYRDEVIEICKRWRRKAIKEQNGEGWYMADILLKFIQRIPSADRPQGEWEIYAVSPFDGEDCRCSNCGKTGCAPYWNFCPNCGSRNVMKGADDE